MRHALRPFRPLAIAAALLPATAAFSASSPWISDEGGRARLVLLQPDQDGLRRGMIEIEPAPGWITYWREPGDSGIPPQFTPEPPAALHSIGFPAPKIVALGDLTDIAYDAPVAFPVRISGAADGVSAQLFIGLCKEICIPFQARLSIAPGGSDTAEEREAVTAAEARVPPATLDGLAVTAASLSATGDTLALSVALGEAGGKAEAIVTGQPGYAFTASGTADAEGRLSLPVPLTGLSPGALQTGTAWKVLLRSGDRAIETEIRPK